jgi:hypothetical protein
MTSSRPVSKRAKLGILVFAASVLIAVLLLTPATARRRIIRRTEADYLHAIIEEGIGVEDIIIGDPNCTKGFVNSRLGEPEKEKDTFLSYKNKYGLDFSFTRDGILEEIKVNSNCKGKLVSGISMSSKKYDVFETYGVPASEKTVNNLNKRLEDLILYKKWRLFGKPTESKIFFAREGLLFWFKGDDILQIVVSQKKLRGKSRIRDKADKELKIEEKVVEKKEPRDIRLESIVESTGKGVTKEENFNVRFPAGAKLVLKNTNGSIKIRGQETNKCEIKANTKIATRDEERGQRLLKRVSVDVRPSEKIVWVEVQLTEDLQGSQLAKVDFEITLPKKADLKLTTGNGSVDLTGITGDIHCDIGNGIITAGEVSGSTRLSINFGEIWVAKADFKKSLITANNGPVTCEEISGNLHVKVNSGDVKVRYAEAAPSVCNVSISTNNGDIDITGPVDFSAMVEAKTMVGAIETDLPLTVKRAGGSKASGKIGKGEGKLRLRTTIGSIKINDSVTGTVNQSSDDSKQPDVPAEVVQ